ncbi:methionyl-tRNA formyltransferase [Luteipulveratus mongoliensis]|uniref:Methionyl-tRNA formyltransferase n=1 Tax=Luteipulveratus mongoliensis TaxID=571913 RepID=A0A0K1JJ47_9MICO|nr:methionyl-tRNA formyltransferase [Luteipulveratus mongoliensis]AKU16732.1 methionyl-tRNA formyltransferase [Luteipulveratus mongoliensis]
MRVVFAGTPEVALPSLDALLDSDHEVVAVITRPDARAGRGRRAATSPIRRRAEEVGLEVLAPGRPSDPEFQSRLAALSPDACPVVAYGALVPRSALDIPRLGWINLHFSLLPAWRGAAPVQHAVLAGDEVTGATTFILEEGMDTGPVLGTLTETIRRTDTSGDLLERLGKAGAGLLVASLDALADGSALPVPQPAEGVSLAPKITVEDAEIRWQQPAFAVDRRVRACTPEPGAWSTFRGERLKIQPVEPVADVAALPPGHLRVAKREVLVGTATTPVRLGLVQPAGKKPMAAADWARGVRAGDEEVLGA